MFRLSFIYPEMLPLLLLLVPIWALALLTPRRLDPIRFWTSLGLRTVLVLALVLGLAGTQLVRPVDRQTTVFLLDGSDSLTPSARAQAETFIAEALAQMEDENAAALVVFGGNALVERAPSGEDRLGRIASLPIATRTNIEQAIQLGLALFPSDTQKRLVLLSDGGENDGAALEAARIATARGVPISVVDLSLPGDDAEALVASLDAPAQVREGQEAVLTARIESSVAQPATVRLLLEQTVIAEQPVDLQLGLSPPTLDALLTAVEQLVVGRRVAQLADVVGELIARARVAGQQTWQPIPEQRHVAPFMSRKFVLEFGLDLRIPDCILQLALTARHYLDRDWPMLTDAVPASDPEREQRADQGDHALLPLTTLAPCELLEQHGEADVAVFRSRAEADRQQPV
ncbi:VWA domain-containing protein [Candidatus Gracilibacteria bacterium]|nr:VWA domain-containing protein [Candidatus Gracilibacteria bacterium]